MSRYINGRFYENNEFNPDSNEEYELQIKYGPNWMKDPVNCLNQIRKEKNHITEWCIV